MAASTRARDRLARGPQFINSAPGSAGRLESAYRWLSISLEHLPRRRHPDAPVRDQRKALAHWLTASATEHLAEAAQKADAAAPQTRRIQARAARCRDRYDRARSDRDKMRAAYDWLRAGLGVLSRQGDDIEQARARWALRDLIADEAAAFLASAARQADEGEVQ